MKMKPLFMLGAITSLLGVTLSLSWAATSLNSSRSNIYRLIYDDKVISQAQATALLAELDKLGPADEATLKKWLAANFKRLGIQADRIKEISIRVSNSSDRKGAPTAVKRVDQASPILILLLADPADVAQALAVSDEGASGPKIPPKK